MLGNKDFAQMISSGSVMSGNSDGKTRFDLKQISKWDKENSQSSKKKVDNPFKQKEKEKIEGNAFGYRDRALERRKDLNTEETKFEEIVSKLDPEQTKFLGGDLEHTHFVKGLDYALLEKIRQDTIKANKIKQVEGEDTVVSSSNRAAEIRAKYTEPINDNNGITTTTLLGANLQKLLFPKQEVVKAPAPALFVSINTGIKSSVGGFASKAAPSSSSTVRTGPTTASSAIQVLARTFYRFDLQPSADGEVKPPVTIQRSIKDVRHSEGDHMVYCLEPELLARVSGLFDHGKMVSTEHMAMKRKRKEKEAQLLAAKTAALPPPPVQKLSSDFDSIYDDDIPVGRYVPVGALDLESGEVKDEESAVTVSAESDASAKGIFGPVSSNLNSSAVVSDTTSVVGTSIMGSALNNVTKAPASNSISATDSDLMKPIRDLLEAQANKERVQQQRLADAVSGSSTVKAAPAAIVVGTDASGKALVHRDVFATTKDKVVRGSLTVAEQGGRPGDSFLHGKYDIQTDEYEVFSDDGEDEEDEGQPPTKKAHISADAFYGDDPSESGGVDKGPPASSRGVAGYNAAAGFEGTIKKSLIKNSVTPWNRAGMSGAEHKATGGGGATVQRAYSAPKVAPGGLNRAARRAAGEK